MDKKDLASKVSKTTGCTKRFGEEIVDALFAAMRDAVITGNRIEIRGFGVFEVRKTKPNPKARNPMTGEIIYIPARRKVHFKPGKAVTEELHKPLKDTEK